MEQNDREMMICQGKDIKYLIEDIAWIRKQLEGNGKPGLIEKYNCLETKVELLPLEIDKKIDKECKLIKDETDKQLVIINTKITTVSVKVALLLGIIYVSAEAAAQHFFK